MHIFLSVILLLATPYVDISFYSYGSTFINTQYNYYNLGFYKPGLSSNIAIDRTNNIYTIQNLYLDILINHLGSVNIGFKRLKSYPLMSSPYNYIGIDFYNPKFSFGVFKRHQLSNDNIFTIRAILKDANRYAGIFVNKEYNTKPHINSIVGKKGNIFEIYGGVSLSEYLSFASQGILRISSSKSAFSLSFDYTFKNYYSLERKIQDGLNLNMSFSFHPMSKLTYSNNLSFTYRNSYKTFIFNNSLDYILQPFGVINLHHSYNSNYILGIKLSNHIDALYYTLFADKFRRGYSLTLQRRPLRIRLSQTINKGIIYTRIGAGLKFKWLREDIEYFYTEEKQYLILRSNVNYKKINLYSNAVIYTTKGKRNLNFITGFNIRTGLRSISLSKIEGIVYYDKNANSVLDKEDEPLESIKVILDKKRFAYTNKDGKYKFNYVSKGRHTLYIDLGILPAEVGSVVGDGKQITIGVWEKKNIDFPISKLGRVKGRLFVDVNLNNVFDDNDIPLQSCLISINGKKKTWSWKDGEYVFDNIPPGSYRIKVEYCPKKVIPVEKDFYDIYVMPGDNIIGLDFPFIQGEEIKVKVKQF